MAFIERISEIDRFNVTHAAGRGAPNWWTDIMLVQYLINKIYMLSWDGGSGFDPSQMDSITSPVIRWFRPRAIVSTSGSSGIIESLNHRWIESLKN